MFLFRFIVLLMTVGLFSCAGLQSKAEEDSKDMCSIAIETTAFVERELLEKKGVVTKGEVLSCIKDSNNIGHFYARFVSSESTVDIINIMSFEGKEWKVISSGIISIFNTNTGEMYLMLNSGQFDKGLPNNQKEYDI